MLQKLLQLQKKNRGFYYKGIGWFYGSKVFQLFLLYSIILKFSVVKWMFLDFVGQEFGQDVLGRMLLFYDVWGFRWEGTEVGGIVRQLVGILVGIVKGVVYVVFFSGVGFRRGWFIDFWLRGGVFVLSFQLRILRVVGICILGLRLFWVVFRNIVFGLFLEDVGFF